MSAHKRIIQGATGRVKLTRSLSAGFLTVAVVGLLWLVGPPSGPGSVPGDGVQVLTEPQMKQVQGGWLVPKARKQRGCE